MTRPACGRAPLVLAILAILLMSGILSAQESETLRTVEVEALTTAARGEAIDKWTLEGLGRASLDFQSRGSRNVRSRFKIEALMGETADGSDVRISIPWAFIRARFPLGGDYHFRTTFGKSRVTWGDGALYNAGDLVFGADGQRADLFSSGAVRDETDWLITAFFPLGQFAFIEPVILVPESRLSAANSPDFDETALGSRIQWRMGSIKAETGYFFRGAVEEHDLSLSLQGNLGPDLYAGAATTLGPNADGYERLRISAGALHQLRQGTDGTLSFRLETLVYPDDTDTLSLYPEISWSPTQSTSFFYRMLIAPVDVSALSIIGAQWSVYQGFTLAGYLTVQGGDQGDTYSFDRPGGVAVTTSVTYVY